MLEGAMEETTPEQYLAEFQTNVFGIINVTRGVLPLMRAQRSGVIAKFGSIGSWCGVAGAGLYASTKWAISGLTESLREEVQEFGIKVVVIEPGCFRPGFLNVGVRVEANPLKEYGGTAARRNRDLMNERVGNQPGDVSKRPEIIVDVLTGTEIAKGNEVPLRLPLGTDAYVAIKEKCNHTLALLEEWKEVMCSTDYEISNRSPS